MEIFEKFPKFSNAHVLETILEPGDCIHIPRLWWHSVRGLDPSISVNLFYGHRANITEIIPSFIAAGPNAWITFFKDFIYHGLLRIPFKQRLYTTTPFGVWYYDQIHGYFRKRLSKFQNYKK